MELSREELEKAVKWLSDLQRDAEKIVGGLEYVLYNESEPYNISAYDLDGEICMIYMDCSRCPIKSACDFYELECKEPKDCSTCTKIKVCAQNRSPALIKYLMEKGSGSDSTQVIARVPEVEYLQEGRFLLLRRGDSEIKFEAQPEIVADSVKFRLHIVSPDAQPEAIGKIAKAFGFHSISITGEEAVFVGEKADLHVVCRVEKAVKQADEGYIIAYQPRFTLEFVLKF